MHAHGRQSPEGYPCSSIFRLLQFVRFFLYFILPCATIRGEIKITNGSLPPGL